MGHGSGCTQHHACSLGGRLKQLGNAKIDDRDDEFGLIVVFQENVIWLEVTRSAFTSSKI
jgi:hypothetical protein